MIDSVDDFILSLYIITEFGLIVDERNKELFTVNKDILLSVQILEFLSIVKPLSPQ